MKHQAIKSLLFMVLEASESKFNVPGDSVSEKDWSMCFQVEGLMLYLQVAERVNEQKSTKCAPCSPCLGVLRTAIMVELQCSNPSQSLSTFNVFDWELGSTG